MASSPAPAFFDFLDFPVPLFQGCGDFSSLSSFSFLIFFEADASPPFTAWRVPVVGVYAPPYRVDGRVVAEDLSF
jgi:hypothetical protein